ncbi:hypothetical protein ACFY1L_08305 [Streptomyces sp. NPDC001663]|uniref:hypothetical protein n=1 Tax=Streptomyces sp. NPDC001663 TaxID=3364597 RepID=UPI003681F5C7
MTWPAALPVAALRVMRTAAGRRALQVAVVVGGLFALGFLCGEQAHAAEGAPVVSSSEVVSAVSTDSAVGVRSLTDGTVGRPANAPVAPSGHQAASAAEPKPDTPAEPKPTPPATPAPADAKPDATAPAQASVSTALNDVTGAVGAVEQQVVGTVKGVPGKVGPVGDLVETVTEGLGKATAQIPPLSSLPSFPTLPSLPTSPGLPVLPGQTLPAPVTQPGSAGQSSTGGGSSGGHDGAAGAEASGTAYGPRFGTEFDAVHNLTQSGGHQATGPRTAPAHPAPDGDPTGALGSPSAVDNGTQRHGDGHAVALNHRAPLRLLPGAAARAAAAETRDRHRDIPVSPA